VNLRTLILRGLRFHWRAHLGVLLGAAVGSAALIGALVVGDSVRGSLREMALQRLGNIHFAMDTGDRVFRARLAKDIERGVADGDDPRSRQNVVSFGSGTMFLTSTISNRLVKLTTTNAIPIGPGRWSPMLGSNYVCNVSPVLKLAATASSQSGESRANNVQLLGVDNGFGVLANSAAFSNLPPDAVVLNAALAAHLRASLGDSIILRTRKPDAMGADSPIAPQDESAIVLRLRVLGIVGANELGDFNLAVSQVPPFNAFVALSALQEKTGAFLGANLIVADPPLLAVSEAQHFSWRQWLAQRLHGLNLPFLRPPSPLRTNLLSPEESLARLDRALDLDLDLADFQLRMNSIPVPSEVELRSPRVFLDKPVVEAIFNAATNAADKTPAIPVQPYGVLTYLANLMRHGNQSTPYSMITAAGAPLVPADLEDDEILISQWLADDLGASPGSEIEISYFAPDQAAQLIERTNHFRVYAVLPTNHPSLDRTLMPDFPGVANAEKTGDWDTGFPLTHQIREKDDEYWKLYRGTPKAFVTLAAGQKMWASRYGDLTGVRFPYADGKNSLSWYLRQSEVEMAIRRVLKVKATSSALAANEIESNTSAFDRRSLGFRFEPVREQALAASAQAQDFGGLFLGFSFFLIGAALILMALLFQFGLEQRTMEIGTLLALGFPPKRVRRVLLGEGILVAFIGGVIGVIGGIAYAKLMLRGLTTIWRDAVGTSALHFHVTPLTLVIGLCASVVVCAVTLWFALRKEARRPARELLAEGAEGEAQSSKLKARRPERARWIALGCGILALVLIGWALWQKDGASPQTFFGAGSLLLVAGMAAVAALLTVLDRSEASRRLTVVAMGLRGATRRRKRSLASVALLACGSFMIVAVGANRLDAGRDAAKRSSGTGGFALFAQSTLPVVRDLNTKAGQEFFGLNEATMEGVSVVPFRVRDGDEASCLNLNRAQNPRLLGVKPELLAERKAFTFAKVLKGLPKENPWMLLRRSGDDAIPAIGDAASIQWALGKKVGDTLTYKDERGQEFKIRLVGAVANSMLQGNLIIDEAAFVNRFPGEAGYRMFLIDTPSNTAAEVDNVSAELSRALQDVGLEVEQSARRLDAFNAVQNTYLNTFQILGGLGLLLGSAGLGVVVLRNVLERRGELGLLQAVGFRRRLLHGLILSEHGGLLLLGLTVGMLAALAAILPVLLAPGANVHVWALGATLAGVLVCGLIWTWVATWFSLRGSLLNALRNE